MGDNEKQRTKKRHYEAKPLRPNADDFYIRPPADGASGSVFVTIYSNGRQIFIRPYKPGDEMQDGYYIKKSDKRGRIRLPRKLKQGALKTSPLQVTIVSDCTFVLEPVEYAACRSCGCSEKTHLLIALGDALICRNCLRKILNDAAESKKCAGIFYPAEFK